MEEDFRSYSRIGHLTPYHLLEIANDSLDEYLALESRIESLKTEGTFQHENHTYFNEHLVIDQLESLLLKETIKGVIFLGAFLESYFFEFAAVALGQGYAEKYIEKIDLTAKIVLVPKLVTGEEIKRDLNFWSGIKDLIKWRNRIVHNKTKDAFEFFKNVKDYDPRPLFKEFNLRSLFKSVEMLFDELDRIDKKGLHKFKFGLGKNDENTTGAKPNRLT